MTEAFGSTEYYFATNYCSLMIKFAGAGGGVLKMPGSPPEKKEAHFATRLCSKKSKNHPFLGDPFREPLLQNFVAV